MLLRADAGDAQAQADMGALFYVAGVHKAALYWLGRPPRRTTPIPCSGWGRPMQGA